MATRGVQQVLYYTAWDATNNVPKTGDVANHHLFWNKDGVNSASTNSPSEVSSSNCPGRYKITMTSTECDCLLGDLAGNSTTSGIYLFGVTVAFEQIPNAVPGAAGGLLIAGANAATTFATLTSTGAFTINGTSNVAQTGDSFARIGANGIGLTDVATLILGATAASWNSAGTIGQKINLAAAASDPWVTSIPGSYVAGQAGFILGTFLDIAVSSRLAASAYVAAPDTAAIADRVLARNLEGGSDGNGTLGEASALVRYGFTNSGSGTFTVKRHNGSTWWSGTLSTDPTAAPIIGATGA